MRALRISSRLKDWGHAVKRDVHALYLAGKDPRVPWYAKALAAAVAVYALSPIDLIPDFIPVIGYLDDLVLLPLGIVLVVWLIPSEVISDLRRQADSAEEPPASRTAALVIVVLWVAAALLMSILGYRYWVGQAKGA